MVYLYSENETSRENLGEQIMNILVTGGLGFIGSHTVVSKDGACPKNNSDIHDYSAAMQCEAAFLQC